MILNNDDDDTNSISSSTRTVASNHKDNSINNINKLPVTVGDNDVLLGRGAVLLFHPGNVRYRRVIREHQHEYLTTPRNDKKRVAYKVMETIQQELEGRFLKRGCQDDDKECDEWYEADNETALEKVKQSLRERSRSGTTRKSSVTQVKQAMRLEQQHNTPNNPTRSTTTPTTTASIEHRRMAKALLDTTRCSPAHAANSTTAASITHRPAQQQQQKKLPNFAPPLTYPERPYLPAHVMVPNYVPPTYSTPAPGATPVDTANNNHQRVATQDTLEALHLLAARGVALANLFRSSQQQQQQQSNDPSLLPGWKVSPTEDVGAPYTVQSPAPAPKSPVLKPQQQVLLHEINPHLYDDSNSIDCPIRRRQQALYQQALRDLDRRYYGTPPSPDHGKDDDSAVV